MINKDPMTRARNAFGSEQQTLSEADIKDLAETEAYVLKEWPDDPARRERFMELYRAGKYGKAHHLFRYNLCGAKTRNGGTCKSIGKWNGGRCRMHGGLSTGPKTPEGIERIRAGAAKRRKDYAASNAKG